MRAIALLAAETAANNRRPFIGPGAHRPRDGMGNEAHYIAARLVTGVSPTARWGCGRGVAQRDLPPARAGMGSVSADERPHAC